MSQKNDETIGIAMIVGVIGAVFYVMALFFAAAALFLTFVVTLAALFAWNKPRRILNYTLYPWEARQFVYRGLAGAGVVPAFWLFCCAVFDLPFHGEYFHLVALGGYMLGSTGMQILLEQAQEGQAEPPAGYDALPQIAAEPKALPSPPKKMFRYASWDDEEENGR